MFFLQHHTPANLNFCWLLKPFVRAPNSLVNTWLKIALIYYHRDNSSIHCVKPFVLGHRWLKWFVVFFYCWSQYVARDNYFTFIFYIWRRNEAVNRYIEIRIHFCFYHSNLVRKRNISCARNIHYTSSILVKIMDLIQLFFHMLTLKALT